MRSKPFSEYFTRVFAPYYLRRRPNSTVEELIADNRLDVIGAALRGDPDYYAQTNSDDLILDAAELDWLKDTLGARIQVYDHGGHLGNLGDRQQVADMLDMLGGRWKGSAPVRAAGPVMVLFLALGRLRLAGGPLPSAAARHAGGEQCRESREGDGARGPGGERGQQRQAGGRRRSRLLDHAGRRAALADLRSVGALQPLDVSVQCAL